MVWSSSSSTSRQALALVAQPQRVATSRPSQVASRPPQTASRPPQAATMPPSATQCHPAASAKWVACFPPLSLLFLTSVLEGTRRLSFPCHHFQKFWIYLDNRNWKILIRKILLLSRILYTPCRKFINHDHIGRFNVVTKSVKKSLLPVFCLNCGCIECLKFGRQIISVISEDLHSLTKIFVPSLSPSLAVFHLGWFHLHLLDFPFCLPVLL